MRPHTASSLLHRSPRRLALAAVAALLLSAILSCGGGSNSSSDSGSGGSNNGGGSNPPPSLLTRLSTDSFSNPNSQHATEVEPHIAANGSTLVAAFQMGRIFAGGAADIGFATSLNEGTSWQSGTLGGITIFAGGSFTAVSDPAVAYDRAHATWLIVSLAIQRTSTVVVSRSTDAVTWSGPVTVSNTPDADKTWIACDNTSASPFYGHCYITWDDPSTNGLIWMSTSADGGLSWSAPANSADSAKGIGGVPVVQPNGTVVVPTSDDAGTHMLAFASTTGGASWNASTIITTISDHQVAGNLRAEALPMSAVDAAGLIYVVWQDCRFRTACSANDIVLSTSSDGAHWSAPARIPIDAAAGTADHFIAAIAADPATSGSSAHLALVYHFYPDAACSQVTCALNVGYVTSQDGGATWSAPTTIAGPMTLTWLADTSLGRMTGDYIGVAYANSRAFPALAVARANSGSVSDEAIYSTTNPLVQSQGVAVTSREAPRPGARSDHPAREYYDEEGRYPRKPPVKRRR